MSILSLIGCSANTESANYKKGNFDNTKNGASGTVNTNTSTSNAPANSNSEPAKADQTDKNQKFMTEAAEGGIAEVELGKMASTKAVSGEVKSFAKQMVTDHSKANDELKAIAAQQNVKLPPDANPVQKATADRLSKMTGNEFDNEYVKAQVADHEKTVALFQEEADNGTNAELKAFAQKTLPTLKMHLEMIRKINEKMKSQ